MTSNVYLETGTTFLKPLPNKNFIWNF